MRAQMKLFRGHAYQIEREYERWVFETPSANVLDVEFSVPPATGTDILMAVRFELDTPQDS